MSPQKSGRGGYLIFLLVFLFFLIIVVRQNAYPRKITGMVEYKMITGMKDGLLQVIMLQTPSEFIHRDPVFDTLISTRSQPDILPDSLFNYYEDIKYRVSIFNDSRQETNMFFFSREMFENIILQNTYQFVIDPKYRDSISKITSSNWSKDD